MPKTPLRALRVPDELWRAAQARARDSGETVSEVVRRGLVDYVQSGALDAAEVEAHPAGRPAVATVAVPVDSRFLLVQGMMMQRHGLGADEADAYLRRAADAEGLALDELVESFLGQRPLDQLEATGRA